MKTTPTLPVKANHSTPPREENKPRGELVDSTLSPKTPGAAIPDPPLKLDGRPGRVKRETGRIEVRAGEFREVNHFTLPDRPHTLAPQNKNSWLEQHLTSDGREALQKLCDLECDREYLGDLFTLLTAKNIRIRRKPRSPQSNEIERANESGDLPAPGTKPLHEWYLVSLHPLDRLEAALRGSSMIDIRELQRTAQRAKKLRSEIICLKRTPFVRWLQQKGYIQQPDLLNGLPVPGSTEPYFRGVLSLPRLAKQVGARKRPDFERQLKKIYQHIYERTSGWHDDFVARILNDLIPSELCHKGTNADALQKWRAHHNLTESHAKR
jgi:hypothetical protein